MAEDDFEVDVSKWIGKVKGRMDEFKVALGEAEVTRLKELTPVDTGNLRAGWHVSEITEDEIVVENGVVYAHRINSGFVGKDSLGRQYHQRGVHMVEQAVAETPQIVAQVIKDLKS